MKERKKKSIATFKICTWQLPVNSKHISKFWVFRKLKIGSNLMSSFMSDVNTLKSWTDASHSLCSILLTSCLVLLLFVRILLYVLSGIYSQIPIYYVSRNSILADRDESFYIRDFWHKFIRNSLPVKGDKYY